MEAIDPTPIRKAEVRLRKWIGLRLEEGYHPIQLPVEEVAGKTVEEMLQMADRKVAGHRRYMLDSIIISFR